MFILEQGRFSARESPVCLLYTSDAADERSSVDLGGRRIIKKKKQEKEESDTGIIDKQIRQDSSYIET